MCSSAAQTGCSGWHGGDSATNLHFRPHVLICESQINSWGSAAASQVRATCTDCAQVWCTLKKSESFVLRRFSPTTSSLCFYVQIESPGEHLPPLETGKDVLQLSLCYSIKICIYLFILLTGRYMADSFH